jgi:hypothetical protein
LSREFEVCSITLSGELDQIFAEPSKRIAHQLKIFRHRQEPAADHLENVPGIVSGQRFLTLELITLFMARLVQGPNQGIVLLASDVIILLVVIQVLGAEEANLVMYAV